MALIWPLILQGPGDWQRSHHPGSRPIRRQCFCPEPVRPGVLAWGLQGDVGDRASDVPVSLSLILPRYGFRTGELGTRSRAEGRLPRPGQKTPMPDQPRLSHRTKGPRPTSTTALINCLQLIHWTASGPLPLQPLLWPQASLCLVLPVVAGWASL